MYKMMKLLKSISIYSLFSVIGYCLMANAPSEMKLGSINDPMPINSTPKRLTIGLNVAARPVTQSRSTKSPVTYTRQTSKANITFSSADLVYNPGIGDEWSVWIEANGKKYFRGDRFTVDVGDQIVLTAFEDDPTHVDVGDKKITINNSIINSGQILESVFVKEYHGRGAGKTAKWKFALRVNSI